MLKNKLIMAGLMACSTAVVFASSAPVNAPAVAPAAPSQGQNPTAAFAPGAPIVPPISGAVAVTPASIDITSCTGANGILGNANAPIRDFCLSQTHHIQTGQVHRAMNFAVEYYKAIGCTAATSILDGNCKNAANTIADGTALAFHLNYKTLNKIMSAVPAGTIAGPFCS